MCFVIVRAYGVNKVDKGPREVLNPEMQKVQFIVLLFLGHDVLEF